MESNQIAQIIIAQHGDSISVYKIHSSQNKNNIFLCDVIISLLASLIDEKFITEANKIAKSEN